MFASISLARCNCESEGCVAMKFVSFMLYVISIIVS